MTDRQTMSLSEISNTIVNFNMGAPKISLYITSKPGSGKSDTIVRSARILSVKSDEPVLLITVMAPGLIDENVTGYLSIGKTKTGDALSLFTVPAIYPHRANLRNLGTSFRIFEKGKEVFDWPADHEVPTRGILHIDDFAHADISVKKIFADVFLNKRITNYAYPKNFTVIGCGNRAQDRSGVTKELSFFTNRVFHCEARIEHKEWLQWAAGKVIPELTSYVAAKSGTCFVDEVPANPAEPYCTPRSLALVSDALRTLPACYDKATKKLATGPMTEKVLEGFIGVGVATEIIAHAENVASWPSIEDISRSPNAVKAPTVDDIVGCFIVSQNIVDYVATTPASEVEPIAAALATYTSHLPDEARDAVFMQLADLTSPNTFRRAEIKRSAQAVCATKQFSTWAQSSFRVMRAVVA